MVSPHSDDGVLSLGAAIASWARRGAVVELLTVLALDPARARLRAAGMSCGASRPRARRRRRRGDRAACADPRRAAAWLPFGSVDYERHGDEDDVRAAVAEGLAVWTRSSCPARRSRIPTTRGSCGSSPRRSCRPCRPLRRAAVHAEDGIRARGARVARGRARRPRVRERENGLRDRLAKWRAIREYGSQLPLLAMERSPRRGPHTLALGPELVAWARGRDRTPG